MPDALQIAASHGVSLTETRRQVFYLVLKAGQPIGAYRVLEEMRIKGGRAMPPTVYRALNFLCAKGLVHRIESLNAFVACAHIEADASDDGHDGQFLICDTCGRAEELADASISGLLRRRAEEAGFQVLRQVVELRGRCGSCAAG